MSNLWFVIKNLLELYRPVLRNLSQQNNDYSNNYAPIIVTVHMGVCVLYNIIKQNELIFLQIHKFRYSGFAKANTCI